MFKTIRTSKVTKIVIYYLTIMLFLEITQPMQMYALTSGPTQPEFNSFTPISTSDMVDLTSGNFNYNIPIMDVGGYPLNLSYDSGVTMDQEASWVGLGWNLNVGQISRQVRGLPDDFKGDQIRYENNMRDNITVGTNFNFHPAFYGYDVSQLVDLSLGIGVQYNNYEGISFKPSFGVSFGQADGIGVGIDFSSSVGEGATVSPSVSISKQFSGKSSCTYQQLGANFGVSYNSRKGLENFSVSVSHKAGEKTYHYTDNSGKASKITNDGKELGGGSQSGSISLNNSLNFTPSKRVAYDNMNFSFNAALGVEIFGLEGQGQITGYGTFQKINSAYKNRLVGAYGYDNTQYKGDLEGVLDFNREKEQTISKNTNALPVTNYNYDVYSIEGQGTGGMFRPYRSQVTHLYNDDVTDHSVGISAGFEIGAAELVHVGVNFLASPSTSRTGNWVSKNNALPLFTERHTDVNDIRYEPVTYKLVGELDVDKDAAYTSSMVSSNALRIKLNKRKYNNQTDPVFEVKGVGVNAAHYTENAIGSKIKRNQRYLRNQVVQKVTDRDADIATDPFISRSSYALPHHTAGMKVLQTDGSTYVYGRPVYNIKKVEATFDVSAKSNIKYKAGILKDITSPSGNNSNNSDKFYNKITTPAYAHSYLLTGVLSNDYEDVDGNGPTENDLGSYTKFEYENKTNYKWRVPYQPNQVSYNEGLKSHNDDEKGNYLYGEKQLTYIKRVITKTHVAIFHLSEREDAKGTLNEMGDSISTGGASMFQLDKISLYSLKEAKAANLLNEDTTDDQPCIPIKEAHFVYNYKLCKKTPNNFTGDRGKLTLEKLYFTYRNSNMGKYTPYVFSYDEDNPDYNADYQIKGFDVWGNYKPVLPGINGSITSPITNAEFPFVEQDKDKASINTAMWVLKKVKLPSGGELTIKTESDDYQYVQDKKAMQMFKVVGAGTTINPNPTDLFNTTLYDGNVHNKYIYVHLGNNSDTTIAGITNDNFGSNYLSENIDNPIYFRFLLNMTTQGSQYDYVSGYFRIKHPTNPLLPPSFGIIVDTNTGEKYAAIEVETLNRDGGTNSNAQVNPIVKAGWGFGRMYLNKVVYSIGGNSSNTNFVSIVQDLVGSIATISELWKGPNKALQDKGCAKTFKPLKSWVRLENPNGHKLGGGLRVKSIELSDNWNVMSAHNDGSLYDQKYGQTYDYNLENGSSSGVATFEPSASPENPFVKPFYPNDGNYADRIAAPKDQNYIEEPFGESFFPAAKITYSRVTVANLERKDGDANNSGTVTKHATGKVVTTHYTSKDFPTKVDYTDINMAYNPHSAVSNLLSIKIVDHLVASQGFSIETNDMDGKIKKQEVFAEGKIEAISAVEYKYNIGPDGKLNNNLTTIDDKGKIETNQIGVEYDIINDFNESNSKLRSFGFDGNVASMIFAVVPVIIPAIMPRFSYHENILRTAVTTKVIHKTGVLKEKIAYDLGSRVSTENLAWDASSGQVILTKTINEFDDAYYSLNYPAYWAYDGMGLASNNIGLQGRLSRSSNCAFDPTPYFQVTSPLTGSTLLNLNTVFHVGDELILENQSTPEDPFKVWVTGFSALNNGLLLMDKDGVYIDVCGSNQSTYNFLLVRSGYRNLQDATMASITSMVNPLDANKDGVVDGYIPSFDYDNTSAVNPRIINASAVAYNDFWKPQQEGAANVYPTPAGQDADTSGEITNPLNTGYNPYLWNVKGDWRAETSYAYLTGRETNTASTRNKGFFKKFSSFYKRDSNYKWVKDLNHWTYASSITKYSPYGAELENRDALNRRSAAQYGYNYNLPMAVASNAWYNEIGFEGFEETPPTSGKKHFEFVTAANSTALNYNSDNSHTGKKSVKVTVGSPVKLIRQLSPKVVTAELRNCPPLDCGLLLDGSSFDLVTTSPAFFTGQSLTWITNNFPLPDYRREFIIKSQCGLPITSAVDDPMGTYEFETISGHPEQVRLIVHEGILNYDCVHPMAIPFTNVSIQIGDYPLALQVYHSILTRYQDPLPTPNFCTGPAHACVSDATLDGDLSCYYLYHGGMVCGSTPEDKKQITNPKQAMQNQQQKKSQKK
jgi:hypothetical protein